MQTIKDLAALIWPAAQKEIFFIITVLVNDKIALEKYKIYL